MKKYILFLSSLAFLLLFLYSCKLITEPDDVVADEGNTTISGTVLDSLSKAPLQNVAVNITYGESKAGPIFTDSKGAYSTQIQITENTTITINTLLEGYIERNDSKKIIQGRTAVDIEAIYLLSSNAEEISISGSVKDSLSLSNLDGAQIDFINADSTIGSVFTNSSGLYSFDLLTVENFDLTINADLEGYSDKQETASVKLGKSSVNVEDILLVPTTKELIKINGQVLNSLSFAPIENAVITIFRGARELGNTFSDQNGNFTFDVLAASNFEILISAELEGFSQQTNVAKIVLGRQEIEIPNFKLTPLETETVTVFGKVLDSLTLSPIQNADIIFTANNNTIATALTNANGEFSESIIIESNLDVEIKAEFNGYNTKSSNATLEFGKNSLKIPDYHLLPESAEDVIVSGQIFDGESFQPLQNVIVRLQAGGQTIETKFTDVNGEYSFEFIASQDFEVIILAELESYFSDSERVFVTLGRGTIDVPDIFLNPENPGGEKESIEPSSIPVFSQSDKSVGIKESGDIETAQIVFEVQDSTGTPLDFEHKKMVHFAIQEGPNGGEFIFPDSAETNAAGQVTVNFSSGHLAGVAQIMAYIITESDTIKSRPVIITVHGGFPDEDHMNGFLPTRNVPGLLVTDEQTVSVLLGDKFSNPVRPNTAVYFSTSGGVIEGSVLTSELGRGEVQWVYGNPVPQDRDVNGGYITIWTINENSETITTQIPMLYTGAPIVQDVTPFTFDIPNGGSELITFSVRDPFNHPIAANSTITVSVEVGAANLSGDVDIVQGDFLFGGSGSTDFSFQIFDPDDADVDPPQSVSVKIEANVVGHRSSITITGTID